MGFRLSGQALSLNSRKTFSFFSITGQAVEAYLQLNEDATQKNFRNLKNGLTAFWLLGEGDIQIIEPGGIYK